VVRHLLREGMVRAAGDHHEPLLAVDDDAAHASRPVASAWAAAAASAALVSGRERSTQPSMMRCEVEFTASAPGGTSRRTVVPAPV